ncbi:hypothetical protein VaNZ11_002206 [Volvox africanus]|uniref:MI domain-containing protein n=1 Tax=Volvox africanus TaxID=51714 RepID=A0ABQ5RRD1_9CHLO|nr:hypothetical protein VaNZ11_002206 [Volvox africanus]
MYGTQGRGGGRGRRDRSFLGRGQGGGGGRRGPALPFSLLRELGDDTSGGAGGGSGRGFKFHGDGSGGGGGGNARFRGRGRGRGRGREGGRGDRGRGGMQFGAGGGDISGSYGADDRRKRTADRPADDASRGYKRQRQEKAAHSDQRPTKQRLMSTDNSGSGRSGDPGSSGLTRTLAAMKQQQAISGAGNHARPGPGSGFGSGSGSRGTSSKTKFHELLVDGWESRNGREAFLEELRLQAQLAKKLGKSKKDALDGMDKLMGFLSAGSGSLLPKYLDREARQEAEELLTKAGSGSGTGDQDPGLGSKVQSKGAKRPLSSAAAAAREVAEILDRESDEELELFGVDPDSNRDDDDDLEEEELLGRHGSESRSESGSEVEEGEEGIYDSEDGDDGGRELASESDGEEDGGMDDAGGEDDYDDDDDDDDEMEEGEEDDGYDMYGQLMASESADEEDVPASDDAAADEEEDEEDEAEEVEGGRHLTGGHRTNVKAASAAREETGSGNGARGGDGAEPAAAEPTAAVAAVAAQQRYVPPALRAQLAAAGGGGGGGGALDAARLQVERRVTGLINRLAEANLQSISREVAELYSTQGRRLVSEAVAMQILGAAESGPRASEQFAAVAAAFVTAVAAQAEAQDLAAGFLAELAQRMEAARSSGDSLAQANLVTVLAYCYSAGLVGPGLCYSLLGILKERFQELDVSAMVTLLNAVGLQLRNADPGLMKEFVLGLHERAAQLGRDGLLSRRAQLMLDLIIDIKNNKTSAAGGAAAAADVSLGGTATRKSKAAAAAAASGAGGGGRRGGALAVLQPSVAKWLQQLGVEEVSLRGLTWKKLLAPNKKGMWWMPVAGEVLDDPLLLAAAAGVGNVAGGSSAMAAAAAGAAAGEGSITAAAAAAASTAKLLQLAAAQQMNTDARRVVFVAIMGSEDCTEAHEKLLRLPLKGDQRREIVRVLVNCCLDEKAWNPYYAFLAIRLCGGDAGAGAGGGGSGSMGRAHRVTMQYCLWDKFKEVESMDVRQLTHLAKLAALLVARFTLSLSLLKVVDWSDLSAKQMLTWRIFLQHLVSSCKTAGDVKEIFARVAAQPKTLSGLISGLLLFLRTCFGPWVATKLPPGPESDELLKRTRVAEKELAAGAATAAAVLI